MLRNEASELTKKFELKVPVFLEQSESVTYILIFDQFWFNSLWIFHQLIEHLKSKVFSHTKYVKWAVIKVVSKITLITITWGCNYMISLTVHAMGLRSWINWIQFQKWDLKQNLYLRKFQILGEITPHTWSCNLL